MRLVKQKFIDYLLSENGITKYIITEDGNDASIIGMNSEKVYYFDIHFSYRLITTKEAFFEDCLYDKIDITDKIRTVNFSQFNKSLSLSTIIIRCLIGLLFGGFGVIVAVISLFLWRKNFQLIIELNDFNKPLIMVNSPNQNKMLEFKSLLSSKIKQAV